MARYLIELEHEAKKQACLTAIETIMTSGSHFLTHAEWGCEDHEHKCWIIVEVDSKEEARSILPPIYRKDAKIISISRFTKDDLVEAVANETY